MQILSNLIQIIRILKPKVAHFVSVQAFTLINCAMQRINVYRLVLILDVQFKLLVKEFTSLQVLFRSLLLRL